MRVEFQSIGKLQSESKTCNKKVCTSLLTKVEKTIIEGEALDALLTQRRKRLLDESASGVKKGSEEEFENLNGFKGEFKTTLSQLQDIENDLRHSPNCGFQGQDQGEQLCRKMPKANNVKKKRKIRTQAKFRLMHEQMHRNNEPSRSRYSQKDKR